MDPNQEYDLQGNPNNINPVTNPNPSQFTNQPPTAQPQIINPIPEQPQTQVFTPNQAIPPSPQSIPSTSYPPQPQSFSPNQPVSQNQTAPQQNYFGPQAPVGQPRADATTNYDQFFSASQLSSDSKKRKIGLIAIGILIVAFIIGGFLFANKNGGPLSSITDKLSGNTDVIDRSDGTLDLSNLSEFKEEQKSQELKAKLNQQINLANGMSYMVTGVERDYQSNSEFLKPSTNKEFLKVNLVVGNKNMKDSIYASSLDFSIINSAGGEQDSKFVIKEDVPDALQGTDIQPGKQINGSILFEIDKGENISKLVANFEYEKITSQNNSQERITLKSEVELK